MTPNSLTRRIISVDILTASYRICGDIEVSNTGVMGAMNDDTSRFIEVKQATLARVHMPDKLVKEASSIRLVKEHIHLICLKRRQDVGPQSLARGGFASPLKYRIEITNPTYEYIGEIEWVGRFDFSSVMVEGTREFVPMYNARIRAVMLPNVKIKSPAILFNRQMVSSLIASPKT